DYEYHYDDYRNLTSKIVPGGGTTDYRYDAIHRLSATKMPNGSVIGMAFDAYDRPYQTYLDNNGSLPAQYTSYNTTNGELMTENIFMDLAGDPDNGRLMSNRTKILDDNEGMIQLDYSYDNFGRIATTTESYNLLGQSYTNVNTIVSQTHRDLPLGINTGYSVGMDSYTNSNINEYDNMGRMTKYQNDFTNQFGQSKRWSIDMQYNERHQLQHKRFLPRSLGGFYEEKYTYTPRGWLRGINLPRGRSFDVENCDAPEGNIYASDEISTQLTVTEIYDFLLEGVDVTIDNLNQCPDEIGIYTGGIIIPDQNDLINFGITSELIISTASGATNGATSGLEDTPLIGLKSIQFGKVQLSGNSATSSTLTEIDLQTTIDLESANLAGEIAALDVLLNTIAQQYKASQKLRYEDISVELIDNEIVIKLKNAEFSLRTIEVVMLYEGSNASFEGTLEVPVSDQSVVTGTRKVTPPRNGEGNSIYPFDFFELVLDGETISRYVIADDLGLLPADFTYLRRFRVITEDQQILTTVATEGDLVMSPTEFIDLTRDPNRTITDVTLPYSESGLTVQGLDDDYECPFAWVGECDPDDLAAQHQAIDDYLQGLPPADQVIYPLTFQYVMLCDGSRHLIPIGAGQLSTLLIDNFIVLDELVVNGPGEIFPVTISVPDQLYSQSMKYTKNGNIESLKWKNTYHYVNQYQYKYDPLNRLQEANYSIEPLSGPAPNVGEGQTVRDITYDALGNILTLKRYGVTEIGQAAVVIDDLAYQYHSSLLPGQAATPNTSLDVTRLMRVIETDQGAEAADHGFKPGTANPQTAQYSYDGAGRLTDDPYKEMSIAYNHLDLPEAIGDLEYIYDANGRKLAQISPTYTKLYLSGGLEVDHSGGYAMYYGDGRITSELTRGGSNESEGGEGTASQVFTIAAEYWHKDHLGNVRVTFSDRNGDNRISLLPETNEPFSEVRSITDYYPFGLQFIQQPCTTGPLARMENNYQYTGLEHVEEVQLDLTPFRPYDPTIGRWIQIDPVYKYHESGYVGMANNPIIYNDPLGLDTISPQPNNAPIDAPNLPEVVVTPKPNPPSGAQTPQGTPEDPFGLLIDDPEAGGTFGENPWPVALATAGLLLADDLTGIGVWDDPAIIWTLASAATYDLTQRTFVTYVLYNPQTGQFYGGRTSGFADPLTLAKRRFRRHRRLRRLGFVFARVDAFAQNASALPAIIGREQQLIDYLGGYGHPMVANRRREVAKYNPLGRIYHNAANLWFGELHPYTGY
ncbi:MAG: RHS repeat-associated core domain-containing protein, partial [Bacteroidota bacterium]